MLGLKRKHKEDAHAVLAKSLPDYRVPSFKAAILKVLRTLRDPDADRETIGQQVEGDPGLVIQILKLVNSAAFGLSRNIQSLPHAVGLLGRARLESLVLGIAVKDVLPKTPVTGYVPSRFWRGAALRATLARELASELHPSTQAEAFTAALLQDIAVPVMATVLRERYGTILEEWHSNPGQASLEALELKALGFDHAAIGSALAFEWSFPERLVAAIDAHHESAGEGGVDPAVGLVAMLGETDSPSALERLVETANSQYGLEKDRTRAAVERGREKSLELVKVLV